jgi:hypothetical protein
VKFEQSGKNMGRWTQTLEAEFLLQERRNAVGIKRGPQLAHKWNNSLRASSDIPHALLRMNSEARAVIDHY